MIGGTEADAPDAWSFSIDVARAWEDALAEAVDARTRKVALRSAMTLSPDPGGIFDTLLGLVRRGLGGHAGDGRQFVSWIHDDDFVRAVRWLIEHERHRRRRQPRSPHPLPNAAFMRVLREAWGIPVGLPATRWMLEIGAVFMRTETELVLKSRRVVPRRLLDDGFVFKHPHWADAARDLCQRWRAARAPAPAPGAQTNLPCPVIGLNVVGLNIMGNDISRHAAAGGGHGEWRRGVVLAPALYWRSSTGLPSTAIVTAALVSSPYPALTAWRTWVYATRRIERLDSGWRGVLEAGATGLLPPSRTSRR